MNRENIYAYGGLVEVYTKQCLRLSPKKYVFFQKYHFVTHKDSYNGLLGHGYSEHHLLERWELKTFMEIEWEHLWGSHDNPHYLEKYSSGDPPS